MPSGQKLARHLGVSRFDAGENIVTQRKAGTVLHVARSLSDTERAMSTEVKKFDQLIGHMKRQLATGGITYAEAVIVDDLISILEHVRSRAAEPFEAVDRRDRVSPRSGRGA